MKTFFPDVPLCPVCAGSAYTKNRLYPQYRYCKKHGIAMSRFDFSRFEDLFAAQSKMRLAVDLAELWDVSLIFETPGDTSMDLTDIMKNMLAVYSSITRNGGDIYV